MPADDSESYAVAAVTPDRPAVRALALVALLSAVGALASPAVAADAPPVADEIAIKLDARIDAWRTNRRAPGVAAAVRFPDGSLWIGISGRASVGAGGRALTKGTPFAVASLTKTFIAALVLQLVEQGRLSLGDRLSRWMPDYPRAKDITVRMLLGHRSGIFDYFAHSELRAPGLRSPAAPLVGARDPGAARAALLRPGHVLPLLEHELRPARTDRPQGHRQGACATHPQPVPRRRSASVTRSSRARSRSAAGQRRATGSVPGGHRGWSDGTSFRPNTSAATVAESAGAMLASVRDISDWQDALFGGAVLSPASLQRMLAFHRRSGYGLGMRRAVARRVRGGRPWRLAAGIRVDHVPAARPRHRRRHPHEPRQRLAPVARRQPGTGRDQDDPRGARLSGTRTSFCDGANERRRAAGQCPPARLTIWQDALLGDTRPGLDDVRGRRDHAWVPRQRQRVAVEGPAVVVRFDRAAAVRVVDHELVTVDLIRP